MKRHCSVYIVDGRAIVLSMHVSQAGIGLEWEPVRRVDNVSDAEALGQAILAAMADSKENVAQPSAEEWKLWRRRFLKMIGAKSERAVASVTQLMNIWSDGDEVFIARERPARDGRGFEPAQEPPTRLGSATAAVIGTAVQGVLSRPTEVETGGCSAATGKNMGQLLKRKDAPCL